MAVRSESRTSSMGIASSSSGFALRRNVMALPFRRSRTPVVMPANTRAMFWSSLIKNCTAVAISRTSSREASWTSSIVTRSPLPQDVISRAARSNKVSKSSEPGFVDLASTATGPTPSLSELGSKATSFSSLLLIDSRRSPDADTLMTSQPWSSAIEASSERSTVFPEPRGPVMRINRPGAPSPFSSPSMKSSMTLSRPTSTGGILPAVGLNGLR